MANKQCGHYLRFFRNCCRPGAFSKECVMRHLRRRLPIINWAPTCTVNTLLYDLAGGLTVGLTAIPQSLAYAQLASMPLENGLYTMIVSGLVYAFFGTARDISMGPTSLISLIVGGIVDETGLLVHQLLCFFTAIIVFSFAFLRLEVFLNIFPMTVTTGFTSAAAILISASQIKYFFGINKLPRSFIQLVPEFFKKITETNVWDLIGGILVLAFLLIVQYTFPLIVRTLSKQRQTILTKYAITGLTVFSTLRAIIAIIISAGIAFAITAPTSTWTSVMAVNNTMCSINGTSIENASFPIANATMNCSFPEKVAKKEKAPQSLTLTGPVPRGLPRPGVPPFGGMTLTTQVPASTNSSNATMTEKTQYFNLGEIIAKINIGLLTIPLISTIELLAIGRALGQRNGYTIDASQEMLACGLAHLAGAFLNAYPSASAITRSALNSQCAVKTQLCSAITSLLVLIAASTIADSCLPYVPKSCLAAVVIAAALSMIETHMTKMIWRVNRVDIIPTAITFVACLLLDIEYGIFVGVIGALVTSAILGMRSVRTNVSIKETTLPASSKYPCILITLPEGELRYQCADVLKKLWDKTSSHVGPVIVDCSTLREIDFSTLMAILHLAKNPSIQHSISGSYPFGFVGLKPRLLEKFRNAVSQLHITQPVYRDIYFANDVFAAINILDGIELSEPADKWNMPFPSVMELAMHPSRSTGSMLLSLSRRKSL